MGYIISENPPGYFPKHCSPECTYKGNSFAEFCIGNKLVEQKETEKNDIKRDQRKYPIEKEFQIKNLKPLVFRGNVCKNIKKRKYKS